MEKVVTSPEHEDLPNDADNEEDAVKINQSNQDMEWESDWEEYIENNDEEFINNEQRSFGELTAITSSEEDKEEQYKLPYHQRHKEQVVFVERPKRNVKPIDRLEYIGKGKQWQ